MNPNKLLSAMLTDPDALFRALQDDYNNRLMAEELANERRERAIEMQRENVYDDGQETDPSPLDDEAVTDYRNRRGE